MRFSASWKQAEGLSPEKMLEAERLMFHELTQGMFYYFCLCAFLNSFSSLSMGELDRSFALDRHDRRGYQETSVYWW